MYFKDHGEKEFNKSYDGWEVLEAGMDEGVADLSDITTAVEQVFEEYIHRIEQYVEPEPIELGDRWDSGTMVLQPADDGLQAKEIPLRPSSTKSSWCGIACVSWSNKSMPTNG